MNADRQIINYEDLKIKKFFDICAATALQLRMRLRMQIISQSIEYCSASNYNLSDIQAMGE